MIGSNRKHKGGEGDKLKKGVKRPSQAHAIYNQTQEEKDKKVTAKRGSSCVPYMSARIYYTCINHNC